VGGWNRFTSFVEYLSGTIWSFETSESEPKFLSVRDDLDCSCEEDSSIFGILFELDRLFPELDRGRNIFESYRRIVMSA